MGDSATKRSLVNLFQILCFRFWSGCHRQGIWMGWWSLCGCVLDQRLEAARPLSHFASAVKTPFQLAPQLHNCTPSSHHPREHLRPTESQRRHEMGSSWIVNPFGGRCIVESCLAKVTFHGYKFSRIIVFQRCELHIVKPLKAKLSIIWFVAVQVISLLVPTFSKVLQGQPYSQQKSHATILEYLSLYIS